MHCRRLVHRGRRWRWWWRKRTCGAPFVLEHPLVKIFIMLIGPPVRVVSRIPGSCPMAQPREGGQYGLRIRGRDTRVIQVVHLLNGTVKLVPVTADLPELDAVAAA